MREKFLGKGSLYPKIIAANQGKLKNEHSVINPGDELSIPPALRILSNLSPNKPKPLR